MASPGRLVPGKTGIRGFTTTTESTFGTHDDTATNYKFFNFSGTPLKKQWVVEDDGGEANLTVGPDEHYVRRYTLNGNHTSRLSPMLAGIAFRTFAQSVTQALSSGESAIYDHIMSFDSTTLPAVLPLSICEFPSGATAGRQYAGCAIKSIEISGSRAGFVNTSLEIVGLGADKSTSITVANAKTNKNAETYFTYGTVSIDRGTYNYTTGGTSGFSSTEDVSASVTDFTAKIGFVEDIQYQMGAGSGILYADDIEAVGLEASLSLTFELVGPGGFYGITGFLSDIEAETEQAWQIAMVGPVISGAANSTTYKTSLIFPKAAAMSDPYTDQSGKMAITVDFKVLYEANEEAFVGAVTNSLADFTP